MSKISIKLASELLSEMGLDVAIVADDKDADTVELTELVEQSNTYMKGVLTPIIKSEVEQEIIDDKVGRMSGSMRSAITRIFGIPRKELGDMGIDEMVLHAKNSYDTAKGNSVQEWEQKYNELVQERDALEEKLPAELERVNKEWQDKYDDRDIDAYFLQVAEKQPRKGGDVSEHAAYLKYKAAQEFKLKWDAQNKTVIPHKDDKPVLNGNKPYDFHSFAKATFEKAGILATDMRHIDPTKVKDKTETTARAGVAETDLAPNLGGFAAYASGEA